MKHKTLYTHRFTSEFQYKSKKDISGDLFQKNELQRNLPRSLHYANTRPNPVQKLSKKIIDQFS